MPITFKHTVKFNIKLIEDLAPLTDLSYNYTRILLEMLPKNKTLLKNILNSLKTKLSELSTNEGVKFIFFGLYEDPRALVAMKLQDVFDEIDVDKIITAEVNGEIIEDECYVCEEVKSSGIPVADPGKDSKWLCEDCFKKSLNSNK
jgi:hypothetical protein